MMRLKAIILAAGVTVAGGTAFAQEGRERDCRDPRAELRERIARLRASCDADKDGTLSPEERQEARERFRSWLRSRIDQNGDGRIDREEAARVHAMRERLQQRRGADRREDVRDRHENRHDRREGVRDRHENRRDRREDVRDRHEDRHDRREDVRDERHDGGRRDEMEDRRDRGEDVRDRHENRHDRREGVRDRHENRHDRRSRFHRGCRGRR